jgi:Glyoxalase superfamily protein/Clp amino terminal domain, pathogenicity island component
MQVMRDFRDAKAMAHTLRAALAAKDHKISNSESLELIAQAFGMADWNTLSAAICGEAPGPRSNAPSPRAPAAKSAPASSAPSTPFLVTESGIAFSAELSSTLHQALAYASQRKHQYATLEHLLLALTDDVDASAVMEACKVDVGALQEHLVSYIDNGQRNLVIDDGSEPRQTAGFQRVVQRAVFYAQGRGLPVMTGAEILVGLFSERESPAARLLGEQQMTRLDAVNFIIHGAVREGGGAAA